MPKLVAAGEKKTYPFYFTEKGAALVHKLRWLTEKEFQKYCDSEIAQLGSPEFCGRLSAPVHPPVGCED